MKCRSCGGDVLRSFLDLGTAPPSNSYVTESELQSPEAWYPLRVKVCEQCWLVQTEDYAHYQELFSKDYAYFSSYSSSWLQHAKRYVDRMTDRFHLGPKSLVVEVAANDGYLLQYVKARGIPCLGIEPTHSTAEVARRRGIEIVEEFFGVKLADALAARGSRADLIAANNVLAHVPNINDFVAGFTRLLKPQGVATFEFPHLLRLVGDCQFDTVYHEHFSYLSLTSLATLFTRNGLEMFDVEQLETHGGSLRAYVRRRDGARDSPMPAVQRLLEVEKAAGMTSAAYYDGFQPRADEVKNDLLRFLLHAKGQGKRVGAYGAAAKGNTLLNYAGVKPDLLPWVVDRNPAKQGKYMPGSRIPIVGEEQLRRERPQFVLILPWNLRAEIMSQLAYVRDWNCRFVTAVPQLEEM